METTFLTERVFGTNNTVVQNLLWSCPLSQNIPACRSCGKGDLQAILSLGNMPLANSLLREDELGLPELVYPLDLVLCPHCALVQITETVAPEKLFKEYLYFSSYSETMLHHAKALVERIVRARSLSGHSQVIEIASNDGYLLQYYKMAGIPVLGIEPAQNVARVAEQQRGIPTLTEFFGQDLAQRLKENGKGADVIHAHNVLAHVADLNGFVEGLRVLLKEDGIAVIEVPYIKDMIDRCEFDTIYHEHLCYFSLTALSYLFKRHGLAIREIERVPIHGGSLRLFLQTASGKQSAKDQGESSANFLHEKSSWEAARLDSYRTFANRVEELRTSLTSLLRGLKKQGKRLAAYGAAAKGSTLLNYFGIGHEILDFVADRSVHKHGRYMPGVHLPIYAPQRLFEARPDYVLLLTWNFADEIMQQQARYRHRGGKFIIPIPEVKVV